MSRRTIEHLTKEKRRERREGKRKGRGGRNERAGKAERDINRSLEGRPSERLHGSTTRRRCTANLQSMLTTRTVDPLCI